MNKISLTLAPRRPALIDGADTEFEVLLSVAAEDAPADLPPRAPLNLAIVVDRSGSMAGAPLAEAKRCAQFIVEHLGPQDRVALVAFESAAAVLQPSTLAVEQGVLKRAIGQIHSGGQTALHEGWLEGAEQAAPYVVKGAIARVLLLTDGQANVGECDPSVIAADCARLADAGVSTSTYGLGQGFNEDLLGAMAEAGGGQAYYGETAEDLMDPFREEFDLLNAICGRKLRLRLEPNHGVSVRVLNAYRTDSDGRSKLPDLAYGSVAWALLKVRVPAAIAAQSDQSVHVLSACVEYMDGEGRDKASELAHLQLKRVAPEVFAALVEDEIVAARAKELRAADLLTQARAAALQRNWSAVDELLAVARAEAGDNEWVEATLSALEEEALKRNSARFSKGAYYASRKKSFRLAAIDESRFLSENDEAMKPAFTRRKPRQGKELRGDSEQT